jgi:uncharacterized membrane protein (UPF0136 family)
MAELQNLLISFFGSGSESAQFDGSTIALLLKSLIATVAGVIGYIANSEHPLLVTGILTAIVLFLRKLITTIFIGAVVIIALLVVARLLAV